MAVPVDRDIKRRAFCLKKGYQFRLLRVFQSSGAVYAPTDFSVEAAIEQRKTKAAAHFPGSFCRNPDQRPSMSCGYILPKAKCFSASGEWTCTRPHEHDRVIVAAPRDRITRVLADGARALAAAVGAAGLASWPVSNQACLRSELESTHSALRQPSQSETCACCSGAKDFICACKLDAASFFTTCSLGRCIDLALSLLDRLELVGSNIVLLSLEPDLADKLSCADNFPSSRFRVFPFDRIRKCLRWLAFDRLIAVGILVFEQAHGLAQGSPFSPILSRVLLDSVHNMLYKEPLVVFPDVAAIRALGGRPPRQWLASSFHVDDSIWWSFHICWSCILDVVRNVWPADIGLTTESTDSSFSFSHCDLSFAATSSAPHLTVHPRNPNVDFAKGFAVRPITSVFPPFVAGLTTSRCVVPALTTKIWLLAEIYPMEKLELFLEHSLLLCIEVLRLGWSVRCAFGFLLAYNNYRIRYVNRVCKACGCWLRRYRSLVEKHIRTHSTSEPDVWLAILDYWYDGTLRALRDTRG